MNPGSGFAAIDFGTSNSGIALPDGADGVRLVELEPGHRTMPTAVFYLVDEAAPQAEPRRVFGRAALAAYVEGHEGRLMRSMKSLLGSTLFEQATEVGGGHAVRYVDVVVGYLRHLRQCAQAAAGGAAPERVVLGRPVFFVDDDPVRDAAAASALEVAARAAGFAEVAFQYEPIAAALDHERGVEREELVLVADIGGGTSDFAIVRVGPERRGRPDRRDDILANHGVHVAGTDFDRRVELDAILPLFGYGGLGPAEAGRAPREVPSRVYFDLATWHLINTVYAAGRVAELKRLKSWYADAAAYRRLMTVVEHRLGHSLAAAAEQAKIAVANAGTATIDLGFVERGLAAPVDSPAVAAAIEDDLARIVAGAGEALRRAGVGADAVSTLYFTGGSTGLDALVERIGASFPNARRVRGDRLASVAQGLGLHARAVYG